MKKIWNVSVSRSKIKVSIVHQFSKFCSFPFFRRKSLLKLCSHQLSAKSRQELTLDSLTMKKNGKLNMHAKSLFAVMAYSFTALFSQYKRATIKTGTIQLLKRYPNRRQEACIKKLCFYENLEFQPKQNEDLQIFIIILIVSTFLQVANS